MSRTSIAALTIALVGAVGMPAYAAETPPPSPATARTHAATATNGAVRTGLGPSKAKVTPSPASAPAVASAEQAALKQAVATGRSVPVSAETSETTQVAANPNGTFTLTAATVPVRVKKNGSWTPVDLNLAKNPDGTWGPRAAAHPVAFSGGGSGPLLTETDQPSGKAISVSWPAALPAPTISANSATYPNVLPGVDLRVEAVDSGYREILVVHDAAAAANPALRALAFRVTAGNGVDLAADGRGGLSARDHTKHSSLFTESQPMEWDSTPGPLGTPGPDQIAATADLAPVASTSAANGTSATLGLAPDPAAIRHRIVFPLYIDPEIQPGSTNYYEIADFGGAWPSSAGPTSLTAANGNKSPWNSELQLGVCSLNCYYSWNGVGYSTYQNMDYFRFDTSSIGARNGENPNVYSAQFSGHVVGWGGGSSCSSTDAVALWAVTTSIASTHPTWSSQYLNGKLQSGGGLCPGSAINLGAMGTNGYEPGYTQVNLALTANYQSPDGDKNYWTISNSATLTVVYNFVPPAPATPTVQGAVTCMATAYVSTTTPTFGAVGTDINPIPLDVQENFQVDNSAGTSTVESGTSPQVASGTSGPWTATPALTSGTAYEVRASTTNIVQSGTGGAPNLTGPYSAWYPFTVLSTPPTAAPTIGSYDYPADTWGQPSGNPATFTLGTNGAASIAGFAYSVDGGSGSEPVPATGDCGYLKDGGLGTSASPTKTGTFGAGSGELQLLSGGTAQLRVPSNLTSGKHTLYVRSFDLAHNASPESSYTFYVAANYQTASQPGTITAGDTLAGTASGANASEVGTQTANCCGVTWYDGNQLFFNNATAGDTFTVSFTVPSVGTWRLGADMTTSFDYGQLHIQLDGSADLAGTGQIPWDGYTAEVSLYFLDLGTPNLTAGTHTLKFTAVGKNSASSAYRAGLDFLELAPTSLYQAAQLAGSLVPNSSGQNGVLTTQTSTTYGWADNQQLFFPNSNLGAGFALAFTAPVESDYALGVNLTESWDYGELTFTLDPGTASATVLDGSATNPIDAYHPSTAICVHMFLGGMHLTAGSHVLQVTVTGTDASSTGNRYNAGINYLQAVPVTGATDASFTAAMNNHGIVSDGTSSPPGDFDLTGSIAGANLSLQTLQNAGLTPGTSAAPGATFRLNGATFTMPELAANGDDNVIVDGQTIPLPAANTNGVALLLASTCGSSPQGTATINYAAGGPHPSQATVASVPDWASGPAGTAVLVLPYRDLGSTPSTARQPRLYEQILPANPNGTLASITLPTLSQTFLPGTCPQALHLLALGTLGTGAAPTGTAWVGAAASPMDEAVTPAGGSFSDVTLREQVALGLTCASTNSCGGQVRVHLSNAHVSTPVTFDAATIAAQSTGLATLTAPVPLKFGGSTGVTIPAGGDVYSDPVAMPAASGGTGNLTISLHIPATTTVTSAAVHQDVNLLTSYAGGNDTTNADGSPFTAANASTGDYYLAGVDATDTTTTDGTIAVLGDQTAVNAPAGTAAPGTWAADLPAALSNAGVNLPGGVANTSTGGSAPRPSAWWRLGEGNGATAHDAGTGLNNASLSGGYSWTSGATPAGTSSSLTLSGYSTNGYGVAATSGPVLDTSASFTVSTWVNLSSTTNNAIAVAQDGTNDSGFYLGYLASNGGEWDFYFMTADTTTPAWQAQAAKTGATTGWTHLVGVYDASAKTARLYVNGALAATATGVTTWNATGPLTIGRDKYNGVLADYWPGQISDVRAWTSALTGTQVSAVYNDAGVSTLTSGNALTALQNTTVSEPNLRDVVISLGANDVLNGTSATTIENNLRALVTAVSGQYISDEPNAPVQPFVTTIAPLGLPTSDPREQVRTSVNTWIMNTYQGGQGIDIAASTANGGVADPANPNRIAPSLLTGTTPTAAYYTQIATDVASTIASAVPPIQLIVKLRGFH